MVTIIIKFLPLELSSLVENHPDVVEFLTNLSCCPARFRVRVWMSLYPSRLPGNCIGSSLCVLSLNSDPVRDPVSDSSTISPREDEWPGGIRGRYLGRLLVARKLMHL